MLPEEGGVERRDCRKSRKARTFTSCGGARGSWVKTGAAMAGDSTGVG